jgi:prepilin-type N-terminal cleavage/methylation domain-containing protein
LRPDFSRGFTIIEVIMSMVLFSIITLGLVPLLLSSIKSSSVSSSRTVGKTLAQQGMERARGLPFFSPVNNVVSPKREDLLDIYYPDLTAGAVTTVAGSSVTTGYSGGTYTLVCTRTSELPASVGPIGCPPDNNDGTSRIPTGYTVKYQSQFVQPANTNPQTYTVTSPAAGTYDWDNVGGAEDPTTELVRFTITAYWTAAGRARSYSLTTLVAGGDVPPDRVRANASIDYTLEVTGAYTSSIGERSTIVARLGRVVSRVEQRNFVTADQDVQTADISLVKDGTATDPPATIDDFSGAQEVLHAPPSLAPGSASPPNVVQGNANITHVPTLPLPGSGSLQTVAHVEDTRVVGPVTAGVGGTGVQVVSELPTAQGQFDYTDDTGPNLFELFNQALFGGTLLFDQSAPMVAVKHSATQRLTGRTNGTVTPITVPAARKVETNLTGGFGLLAMLPTTFAPQGIVRVNDFSATMQCRSTGTLATGVTTGSWTGAFTFYQDADGDLQDDGAYVSVAGFNGTEAGAGTDPMVALKSSNALVRDRPGTSEDLYLFDKAGQPGYLQSVTVLRDLLDSKTATESTVTMGQAFTINTVRTDPGSVNSTISVKVAQMSCEAVDKRG